MDTFQNVRYQLLNTLLQSYLEDGDLEKAREYLDKGCNAFVCLETEHFPYRRFHRMRTDRFIEVTKLLTEYGFPTYLFGEKLLQTIDKWTQLSAGKWIWLLKNGTNIPEFLNGFSLMHRIFYNHFLMTEDEQNELLFWLFETGNVNIFEENESIFDLILNKKHFHMLPTIEIFKDTFDEKTTREYKKVRMTSLFS